MAAGFAQSQNPASRLSFEVAAIRSASPPTPQTVQSGQFRTGTKISGNNLDFEFVTLADLIPYAYRVKTFQVAGPDWIGQLRWNILAKLPDGTSRDQAPDMMQTLLVDRFRLAFHHEKRQQPVYELVVMKGGPKLTPAENTAGDDSGSDPANVDIGLGRGGFLPPGPGGAPPPDGAGRGGRGAIVAGGARISPGANCGMQMEFDKLTMQALADTLTPFLDRPVVDATALKGAFKVTMDLPMDTIFAMMQNTIRNSGFAPPGQGFGAGGPGGRGDGPGGGRGAGPQAGCFDPSALAAGGTDTSNTAVFQAVQKLGLRLQPVKAPFDTIVVDRLEKAPTEN